MDQRMSRCPVSTCERYVSSAPARAPSYLLREAGPFAQRTAEGTLSGRSVGLAVGVWCPVSFL